jgi:hypothetical protein
VQSIDTSRDCGASNSAETSHPASTLANHRIASDASTLTYLQAKKKANLLAR